MKMQPDEMRAIRKSLGLNQADFGKALGLSGPYVGEMERGEKRIEQRAAQQARLLKLRERWLLEIADLEQRLPMWERGDITSTRDGVDTTAEHVAFLRASLANIREAVAILDGKMTDESTGEPFTTATRCGAAAAAVVTRST